MSRTRKAEPRCRQLNLSLTDREMEGIRRRAAALAMRPARFSRAILLNERRSLTVAATDAGGTSDRLVYQQIARLGANLNQMMRFCHRTGFPPPADLTPLLRDVREILKKEFGNGA